MKVLHHHAVLEEHQSRRGGRLGRNVHFMRESVAFPVTDRLDPAKPLATKLWTRRLPAWNQGQLGKCTVMGGKGTLLTAPVCKTLGLLQIGALRSTNNLYKDETANDPFPGQWPPTDTGSSVLAFMQMAKRRGFITAYHWGFSFQDCLRALSQLGPVEVGVNWYDSFDSPSSAGVVSLPAGASVRGGHAFEILGVDVERQQVAAINSWGTSWGVKGRFYLPYAVLERLLGEQGECAVPQAA